MLSEAVAAGDGALQTLITRPLGQIRKSSTRRPSPADRLRTHARRRRIEMLGLYLRHKPRQRRTNARRLASHISSSPCAICLAASAKKPAYVSVSTDRRRKSFASGIPRVTGRGLHWDRTPGRRRSSS